MKNIILITGGTKSGKSEFAEYLAKKYLKIKYIALSQVDLEDNNWKNKIKRHQIRRPSYWKTLETVDIVNVLKNENDVLLVDSIGGYVTDNLSKDDKSWKKNIQIFLKALNNYKRDVIIVGEQVGWGLVSEYEIGNKFTERLGEILNEITKIANENLLEHNLQSK